MNTPSAERPYALDHPQARRTPGHMMVARVWRKYGLKPHRVERYIASNDPNFEKKAADIVGLYLNQPAHAAVFCLDEKTQIHFLDRKDPILPLSPGGAERHASAEFAASLADIGANQPRGKEIHVIADNLAAHKNQAVKDFRAAHREFDLRFHRSCGRAPWTVKWKHADPSRHINTQSVSTG